MNRQPALVAIDLGAESCRVSLLQWRKDAPALRIVHRFAHGPVHRGGSVRWDLKRICQELEQGLQQCAELAPEGIASIGVTGWAVDYVRLNAQGELFAPPYCYRDPRTQRAMAEVHQRIPAERLYSITGVQIQPINTVYQLYADKLDRVPDHLPWVNLPEYILHWLGAPRIAEYTNASHTALLDAATRQWSHEIFHALDLEIAAAPELVAPGTLLGPMKHRLASLPAFQQTQLIAPACHDTASAIAGIPPQSSTWAYISSGTWSLVGTLLASPQKTPEACHQGFTNLGAATGDILFHRGITGMWLLRQCMNIWEQTAPCSLENLIEQASKLPKPECTLNLDDPNFLLAGNMLQRINEQLKARGAHPLPLSCEAAPAYANLLFHSLAERYAALIRSLHQMTGKPFDCICVVGGGSRNEFLNALTAEAAHVSVQRCSPESSTLGNLALQWARLEHDETCRIDSAVLEPYTRQLNTLPAD